MSCPIGVLLLFDFGLLRPWSGDVPPVMAEGLAEPDVVRHHSESCMSWSSGGCALDGTAARVYFPRHFA